jgi:hypothetical protein
MPSELTLTIIKYAKTKRKEIEKNKLTIKKDPP